MTYKVLFSPIYINLNAEMHNSPQLGDGCIWHRARHMNLTVPNESHKPYCLTIIWIFIMEQKQEPKITESNPIIPQIVLCIE